MNTEYDYALEFYNLLVEDSEPQVIEGIELTVFKGAVTKLFRGMGVSQSYYSKIMPALKDLGCVTVLKRGARGVDSLIALHHPPDEMEFLIRSRSPLTNSPQAAKVAEQIEAINKSLGGLDVVAAIENLDKRLKQVERKLREA